MTGFNSRNIDQLHPAVARGCREFILRMYVAGYADVGISATYRDNAYQDWLHAQGRTRPGNIVTNARGGQSIHNFRLAFDFFRNIQGQAFADRTPEERDFWDTAGRIWVEMGGAWGGNWIGFVDRPHCEYTGGLTLRNLQNGIQLADSHLMPWEEETKVRFNTIADLPEWARAEMQELINSGTLQGVCDDGNLDFSLDMVRTLILSRRMIDQTLGLCPKPHKGHAP